MRAKFIAPARREFLKEVVFYNEQEPGLGVAFAQEVEEAPARALAFPEAGSPATKTPSWSSSRDSHFLSCIVQIGKALLFLQLPIIHVSPRIGRSVYKSANKFFQSDQNILAGPHGDDARALLVPGSKLVWEIEASSHFEAMTKYYEYMGWGEFTTDRPEQDKKTYKELGWE